MIPPPPVSTALPHFRPHRSFFLYSKSYSAQHGGNPWRDADAAAAPSLWPVDLEALELQVPSFRGSITVERSRTHLPYHRSLPSQQDVRTGSSGESFSTSVYKPVKYIPSHLLSACLIILWAENRISMFPSPDIKTPDADVVQALAQNRLSTSCQNRA